MLMSFEHLPMRIVAIEAKKGKSVNLTRRTKNCLILVFFVCLAERIFCARLKLFQSSFSMKKENKKNSAFLLSWEAVAFENPERHPQWKVVVFVILVSALAYGLFTDNFLFSFIAILTGLLIYLFQNKEPETFKFGITSEGVFAQDHLYEYDSLKSFWIFFEPGGRKELSLRSRKKFMPYIEIPLGEADPVKIHRTLRKFIKEEKQFDNPFQSWEKFF